MWYHALATDYDGTLASQGRVREDIVAALQRVRATGRRLVMVTGRELEDLMTCFGHLDLFERVVCEDGALLYRPATREEKVLSEPPPARFAEELRRRGVAPLSTGRVIVATVSPYETACLEVIKELGLELQVIFNKGSVMVLPSGVNKGTGLKCALAEMELSLHNTIGFGDAENDHAFLSMVGFSVAVKNALPAIKEKVDLITTVTHGDGIIEVIEQLVVDELREQAPKRHRILLGHREDDREVTLIPYRSTALVAGPSGSGKTSFTASLLERLVEQQYQVCIVDPEGDHEAFEKAVVVGDSERPPSLQEVMQVISHPDNHVVANLLAIPLADRPKFFGELFARLQELRARTGRPHLIVVDEAHHLLPSGWDPAALTVPQRLEGLLLITVHPASVAPAVLRNVDFAVAVGSKFDKTLAKVGEIIGRAPPPIPERELQQGEVVVWPCGSGESPFWMHTPRSRAEHRRHKRKYARGELGPDRSFYFRGPEGKLKLRAQNLTLFTQIAEGVDDDTWLFHLKKGDYSRWFAEALKDDELAHAAARVESDREANPQESRHRIAEAISARYTLPT